MIRNPHLILAAMVGLATAAQATTFSFLTDTWTNPATGGGTTTQTGFVSQTAAGANNSSSGTVTKDGITLSFTGSFVGTAVSSSVQSGTQGPSFSNASTTNPIGFILGTTNDDNAITFSETSFSGSVTNYQRWNFSFSQPVILQTFRIQDVDSNTGTASAQFRDIIAAEAFTTVTPGAAGTGVDAAYNLGAESATPGDTNLLTGTATFGSNAINAVGAPLDLGNPNNTPEVRTLVSFGSTAIRSFSIYAFSDNRQVNHRVSLDNSEFEIVTPAPVPEPSSALLGAFGLGLCLIRRKRA